MPILDQYGKPLAPTKPTSMRSVNARYDGAQTSDNSKRHWAMADSLSAVSANSAGVRSTLRDRSRYEIANNSYARGIINTIAAYSIGQGPTLQLTYRGDRKNVNKKLVEAARMVERLWQTWAYIRELPQKLHTMQLALDGDGEAFAMKTTSTRTSMHTPVTLDLRLYECDHFDNWAPGTGFLNDDSGVKIGTDGRPTEYAFIPQHPGGTYGYLSALSSEWISADDVIHIFRSERPEQLRGIPRTTPALELFALLRRFTLATITAAETAADFAAILIPRDSGDDSQLEPWDRVEIERGAFLTTPAGAALTQMKAEHPNATYDEFVKAILREIARCLSVPAVVALGDASKYNYASGRLDLQAFLRQIEVERALLMERQCLDRLFEAWLDEALLIDGFLPKQFAKQEVIRDFEWCWRWQGAPHVDREKEANGQKAELSNLTTSLAREYSKQGLDWRTEIVQIHEEQEFLQELGLVGVMQQNQAFVDQSSAASGKNAMPNKGKGQPYPSADTADTEEADLEEAIDE